jgi:hypothetical protein
MPVTPSADPERSSVQINNINTWTGINDIITPDKIPGLVVRPTVGLFGFLAKVNTVSTEKLHACMASVIAYIRPLGSACCISYN